MKIQFEITSIPNSDQKEYFVAYLEGVLKIFLRGELFFNATDILVAELGISLSKWAGKIGRGEFTDFHFETMDSDDSPILAFKYNGKSGFLVESVWQEFEWKEPIDKTDLLEEIERFLEQLSFQLDDKCHVKFEDII